MNRILVTGAGGPAGINVIKLLRGEYYVVSTDINPYSEGFAISDRYYLVSPASNEEQFINDIERIIEEEGVDLVIPTVDEEIEVLAKNDVRFSERIVIHPRETVEICLSKYDTYSYLRDRIPEIIPEFSLDPRDLSSEKVVKKPVKGRGSKNVSIGSRNGFRGEEGFFFVEYLPGREWTVDAIADKDGNVMVAVPRIRLKVRGGVSVVGEVRLDRRVIGYVWDEKNFTEDFEISLYLYYVMGKTLLYIPHPYIEEYFPSSFGRAIRQISRWNYGALQSLTKHFRNIIKNTKGMDDLVYTSSFALWSSSFIWWTTLFAYLILLIHFQINFSNVENAIYLINTLNGIRYLIEVPLIYEKLNLSNKRDSSFKRILKGLGTALYTSILGASSSSYMVYRFLIKRNLQWAKTEHK